MILFGRLHNTQDFSGSLFSTILARNVPDGFEISDIWRRQQACFHSLVSGPSIGRRGTLRFSLSWTPKQGS